LNNVKELVYNIFKAHVDEIEDNNALRYLKTHDLNKYFEQLIATFYLYTRPKKGKNKNIYLTEIIVSMGSIIRQRLREKRDSALSARTGAFFLYIFKEMDIIDVSITKGNRSHQAYVLTVNDDELIRELWSQLNPHQIEKMPSDKPYEPWTSYKHHNGLMAIKTGNINIARSISPRTHPIIFDCLNKSQSIGWRINKEIYHIFEWGLKNKVEAFNEIWDQVNPEAKKTKLREAKSILEMATKFLNQSIYH